MDLTPLQGDIILLSTGYYNYSYSICENAVYCNGTSSMISEYDAKSGTCLCNMAEFGNQKPVYYNLVNEWEFTYGPNGAQNTFISITWRCDYNVPTYRVDSYHGICGGDTFDNDWVILSRLACPEGRTPTTTPPAPGCKWNDSYSNHYINLEPLGYNSLSYWFDPPLNSNGYVYSICHNGLYCNSNFSAHMVLRMSSSDISNPCVAWLADWDPTIQPNYNVTGETWVFRYANGERCLSSGFPIITWFYWVCNETEPAAQISKYYVPRSCEIEYTIQSVYACN